MKQEHHGRNEEHVKGEEPAQGRPPDGVARQYEAGDPFAHHRHATRLRRTDDHRPDRGLVPPEQLSGKGECQRQQQQDGAAEPVELAGELVRRHQIGAGHVDTDQQHHGGGAEVVHPAQEPPEQRLLRDELEAVVRLPARRHVGGGQRDTGGDLEDEGEQRGTAEDVPPPGARRHRVLQSAAHGADDPAAIVDPGEQTSRSRPSHAIGNRAGLDLDLSAAYPHRISGQRLRRRSRGHRAVGVVHAAVAGAEKEPRLGDPAHRAAEMSAVHREGGEVGRVVASKPRGSAGRHAGPRQRRRVLESDAHGFADRESDLPVPTARHARGGFRVSGASRNPMTGNPMTAPIAAESATDTRAEEAASLEGRSVGARCRVHDEVREEEPGAEVVASQHTARGMARQAAAAR